MTRAAATRHNWTALVVLLTCAALFSSLCNRYDVVQDDAYISLVYSKNLVEGLGLEFNPGERVEGYTNFAWVLLLALPHVLGIDAVATARLFGLISAIALILLSARAAAGVSSRRRDVTHLVAPCLLAANGALAFWSLSGMETAAFALLVTAGATRYLQHRRLDAATGALFGLAALTRPEGWMFLVLTGAHAAWHWHRTKTPTPGGPLPWSWRGPVTFGALVLPHLLFRWIYYGQLLPNTFYAKTGISLTHVTHGLRYTRDFIVDYGLWGLLFGVALVPLLRRRTRWQASYVALFVAANLTYVTLVGGDTLAEHRLFLPVVALLAALIAEGMRVLSLRFFGRRAAPVVVGLAALLVVVRSVTGPDSDLLHARDAVTTHNDKLSQLADHIQQIGGVGLVASTAIGIPRYLTSAAVLDLVGLTDDRIAHAPQPLPGIRDDHILRKYNTAYVLDRAPDMFLFIGGMRPGTPAERALFMSRRFRQDYRVTYLQDHRPLYVRRAGPLHAEDMYPDGAFVERYAFALGIMRHDPAGAMQSLRQSIALGPDDFAMPHCWLGRLQYEAGDLEAAATTLAHALQMDDTLVMAWAHLAMITIIEDRPHAAVAMAQRAVDLAPRSHFSRYVLGLAQLEARQYSMARQHLAMAVELGGPHSVDALYQFGRASELAGDRAAATSAWQALLMQLPDHQPAIEGLRRINP